MVRKKGDMLREEVMFWERVEQEIYDVLSPLEYELIKCERQLKMTPGFYKYGEAADSYIYHHLDLNCYRRGWKSVKQCAAEDWAEFKATWRARIKFCKNWRAEIKKMKKTMKLQLENMKQEVKNFIDELRGLDVEEEDDDDDSWVDLEKRYPDDLLILQAKAEKLISDLPGRLRPAPHHLARREFFKNALKQPAIRAAMNAPEPIPKEYPREFHIKMVRAPLRAPEHCRTEPTSSKPQHVPIQRQPVAQIEPVTVSSSPRTIADNKPAVVVKKPVLVAPAKPEDLLVGIEQGVKLKKVDVKNMDDAGSGSPSKPTLFGDLKTRKANTLQKATAA